MWICSLPAASVPGKVLVGNAVQDQATHEMSLL
jgi:hypothetical protein